jgi:hypothetical protein
MRDDLRCDCHICEVERHIFDFLVEPPANSRFLGRNLTPAIEGLRFAAPWPRCSP